MVQSVFVILGRGAHFKSELRQNDRR